MLGVVLSFSEVGERVVVALDFCSNDRPSTGRETEQRQPRNCLSAKCSNVSNTGSGKLLTGLGEVVATVLVEVFLNVADSVLGLTNHFDNQQVTRRVEPTRTSVPNLFPPPATHHAKTTRCSRWCRFVSHRQQQWLALRAGCDSVGCGHHVELPAPTSARSSTRRWARVRKAKLQIRKIGVRSNSAGRVIGRTGLGGRHVHATQRRIRQLLAREIVGAGCECLPAR